MQAGHPRGNWGWSSAWETTQRKPRCWHRELLKCHHIHLVG